MRSTALRSIGTRIATPSSGTNAADIGRVALPGSPCCRGLHDLPDEPLRPPVEGCAGFELITIENATALGDGSLEIGEGLEVAVRERLIQDGPEVLGGLPFGGLVAKFLAFTAR